ncbi:MAG TPA: GTPase [Acidimicrobiia bacterium]
MREALTGLIERAELAVTAARPVVEPGRLDGVAAMIADARVRLDYPDDILVVALAGGTGSGKSSLFNALTGTDAATVGATRPITGEPLAAVPSGRGMALSGLLDHLGIEARVESVGFQHCLIDLPDTDSIEIGHRHRVEALMPRLDVLVWVLDPEKYRDAALHHRYIRPLSGYSDQFVFVLNQVDRLDEVARGEVLDDLERALTEDGITDPKVGATASNPTTGPITGIEDLRAALGSLAGSRLLYSKLLTDLEHAASGMIDAIGPALGYRQSLAAVTEDAVPSIAEGDEEGAVRGLTHFFESTGDEVGGPLGEMLSRFAATLPATVHSISGALRDAPASRIRIGRRRGRKAPTADQEAAIRTMLDEAIRPVTEAVAGRARAAAAAAELSVAVRSVSNRPL